MGSVRSQLIGLAATVIVAVVLRIWLGLHLGYGFLALIILWPLVGVLITADDDWPGGWSHLNGEAVSPWRQPSWWAELLLVRAGLVVAAFAVEAQLQGERSIALWCVAAASVVAGSLMLVGLGRKARHQ